MPYSTLRPALVPIPPGRLASYAALLLAGLVFAVSIRSGLFVAGGSDSSGYISAGELWHTATLYRPEPLHFLPAFPNATTSASPLGYREGPIRGTEVPVYPPGLPILIAAAVSAVGPMGSHFVAPLMAGLLVLATFAVGRQLAGDVSGLVAAALVGSSPELLMHSVQAMSDAPAAACWIGAWWFGLRGTVSASAAAGLASGLAILIRPNLGPLAAVIGAVIIVADASAPGERWQWRWKSACVYMAATALGVALLAWVQAMLYGSPSTPGYPGWSTLFDRAYIGANLRLYPRLLAQAHTLLPLAGLLMLPLTLRQIREPQDRMARRVMISACVLLFVNVVLYLPYMPFDHWPFLRFLLPGLSALFILFSAVLALAARAVWRRPRWLALAVPVAVVVAQGAPFARHALQDWRAQGNIRLMGHYLREVLPPNAIVLAFTHSGSIAYYTGKDIVRLDLVEPMMLDRTVDDLTLHGYHPVLVLDQFIEEAPFRQRFGASRLGRLDWAPRARFDAVRTIWYFDPADRDKYLDGDRWPVDTVR